MGGSFVLVWTRGGGDNTPGPDVIRRKNGKAGTVKRGNRG